MANATNTTAVGIGALIVVALMLISAIDKNLNYIWRSTQSRPLAQAFAMYWMILTLGPVLVGPASPSPPTFSRCGCSGPSLFGIGYLLLRGLPFLFSVLTFLLVYTVVPNCKVRLMHAFIGALVAATLFELAKRGFAIYITNFPPIRPSMAPWRPSHPVCLGLPELAGGLAWRGNHRLPRRI